MKKIAVLVAEGFEELELSAPVDILRRLRFDVVTVGVGKDEVTGAHQLVVKTDTTLDQLDINEFDAIVLPGGGGSWVLRDTPEVLEALRQMNHDGKLIAAICAAPIALAKAGVITGKNVSAYPDPLVFEDLAKSQSLITGDALTIDGNILTAKGPAIALDFGYAIGSYLGKKKEEIAELKKAMIYSDVEQEEI